MYQAYKLLSYINLNIAFSELSLKSLKVIQKCAFTIIFFILILLVYLRAYAMFTGDDAAGPIALGLIGILVTAIIAAIIDVLQRPIKNALEKM